MNNYIDVLAITLYSLLDIVGDILKTLKSMEERIQALEDKE